MMYKRIIFDQVRDRLQSGKVILIIGPRRVGKTVLINELAKSAPTEYLLLNGEDMATADLLRYRSVANYRRLLGTVKLLFIDEAQKIENIGDIVKLMIDNIAGLTIVITGSSAFDLRNKFGEPLTGRKFSYYLFPLAQQEFSLYENLLDTKNTLEDKLLFGGYPEVWNLNDKDSRVNYLQELASDYLFKDILELENIRNSAKLKSLLRLLAYQVGKEVSNDELGRQIGLSRNTVEKYLDLLSKVYVIFKVEGFSRNLRKEVTKNHRWYFIDNGILNVLLSNFSPLSLRRDVGVLWENYIISERLKYLSYQRKLVRYYFWRTYDKQEIDWVEEDAGMLTGYEIKWSEQKVKAPVAWSRAYPDAGFRVIHRENYLDWIQ
ncbi:MAG: ATP-binding protein [FCB group bacterium]|nr:ATP-binding protein [FCB group bacterium]